MVSMFVTFDGVAQAPGDQGQDRSGGSVRGRRAVPHGDHATVGAQVARIHALGSLEDLSARRAAFAAVVRQWMTQV